MKMRKKTAMLISFAVGTMLFATTAFAEVVSKSGYDQAKEAMKYSADSLTSKLSSYTVDVSAVLKDNGKVISSQNSVNKYDLQKIACDNVTININGNEKIERFFYRDKETHINYRSNDGVYYITERNGSEDKFWVENPFKEKETEDLERIADALIGSLKDYVVVSESNDGSKEISGSLNETQIPALVNALVSYQFKRQFSMYRGNPIEQNIMPRVSEDIFVKEIKGKIFVDKNGLIQSALGTGVLFGKDEKGVEHSLTFEVLAKVTNVNATTVSKPDLSGKKVEKSTLTEKGIASNIKPEIYLGTYKNNIVIQKDGKFVKIGERIVEIEQIDNKTISGRYHDSYLKGFEEFAANARDFKFNAKFNQFPHDANFEYTNSEGKNIQGNMSLMLHNAGVYFNINQYQTGNIPYDATFYKIFD